YASLSINPLSYMALICTHSWIQARTTSTPSKFSIQKMLSMRSTAVVPTQLVSVAELTSSACAIATSVGSLGVRSDASYCDIRVYGWGNPIFRPNPVRDILRNLRNKQIRLATDLVFATF